MIQFFLDMKLQRKLSVSLGIMFSFLLVVGASGLMSANSLHSGQVEMFTRTLPAIDYLTQADRDLNQLLVAERSMIFAKVKSDMFPKLLEDYNTNYKQVLERVGHYKKLAQTDKEKEFLDKFYEEHTKWAALSKQIVEGRKADTRQGRKLAIDLSLTQASRQFEAMRDNLDKLEGLNLDMAEKSNTNADVVYTSVITILWTVVIVAALFGLGIIVLLSRTVVSPIIKTTEMLKDIAEGEGDLTKRLTVRSKDEIGLLSTYFNSFIEKVHLIIDEIAKTTGSLENSSGDLSKTSGDLAKNASIMSDQTTSVAAATEQASQNAHSIAGATEELSSSVNTIASAIEEMNSTLTEVAQNCQNESNIAQQASEQVDNATKQMNTLGAAAADITKIVSTINDIADQTNLLALNATIEAASAGDAGKGFAVVASEVKDLAKQTADATQVISNQVTQMQDITQSSIKDITEISKIITEVNVISHTIVSAVDEQTATVNEISNSVGEVGNTASSISASVAQASMGLNEVAERVKEVEGVTHNTSDGIVDVENSSDRLKNMSSSLMDIVSQFKL